MRVPSFQKKEACIAEYRSATGLSNRAQQPGSANGKYSAKLGHGFKLLFEGAQDDD
jgi:hypothetical protein